MSKQSLFESLPCSLEQHTPNNLFNVAILGVESTGKTTLCKDLAQHFDTTWTPEFMRPYLQRKWDNEKKTCEWEDLIPIAQGQIALENQKAKLANRYLFCDTNLFELMMYAYWYYNACPDIIEKAAHTHHYDLILLTKIDVPWEPDDLRDSPHDRDKINETFVNALQDNHMPFWQIGGNRQQRVKTVAKWILK